MYTVDLQTGLYYIHSGNCMTAADSVYSALMETLKTREELQEWIKSFKNVPYEESCQPLQIVSNRSLSEKTTIFTREWKFICSIRKY